MPKIRINLASTRLAFFLIAALLLLVVLSAIIPQQDIASGQIVDWRETLGSGYEIIDSLGLDRIYYTPAFFVILGLLAINLTAANVKRIKTVFRVKGAATRLRLAGSILFHLALLLTMTGAILHFLFKYEGVFSLTEGQTSHDRQEEYFREFRGPLASENYGAFSLRLDSLGHTKGEVNPLGSKALVTLGPSGAIPISAEILSNHPLEWGDYEFHFGANVGYSPELHLFDSAGQTILRSFVRVQHHQEGGFDQHYDFVLVQSEGLKIEIEILNRETESESPDYRLAVSRADSSLFSGIVTSADTTSFDRYHLAVPRLRNWCYIGAIRNPYLNLIFTGFWLSFVGLSLSLVGRLVAPRR